MRDDDPEDVLHEVFASAIAGAHPLGRSVLGSEESIATMSRDALRRFYRRNYTPNRMVIAAAGNVDHAQILRLVRKALRSRLSGSDTPVPPRAGRMSATSAGGLVLCTDDTEQAHLMLGVRAINRHDPRWFTFDVLNTALGGGMSSRLFQEVRERRGLAYQVYSSLVSYSDSGHFSVYAGCQPDRLGDVALVVREVLTDVAEHGLSEAEVARGKGQVRGSFVLGLEDTGSRMSRIGKGELNYGEHLTMEQTLERIEAVTVVDVAKAAAHLLGRQRRRIAAAVVGPYSHANDVPTEVHEVIT